MQMKFDRPRCPKCWAYAAGIMELMPVFARLSFDPDEDDVDTTEYAGESEQCWDAQRPVKPDNMNAMADSPYPPSVLLWCEECGYHWPSGVAWMPTCGVTSPDTYHPGGGDCESKS